MQSSIKNQTGEHTVLGNAEALKNGTLQVTDLPEIRIWQDADGKLWTLDHRRLMSLMNYSNLYHGNMEKIKND